MQNELNGARRISRPVSQLHAVLTRLIDDPLHRFLVRLSGLDHVDVAAQSGILLGGDLAGRLGRLEREDHERVGAGGVRAAEESSVAGRAGQLLFEEGEMQLVLRVQKAVFDAGRDGAGYRFQEEGYRRVLDVWCAGTVSVSATGICVSPLACGREWARREAEEHGRTHLQ